MKTNLVSGLTILAAASLALLSSTSAMADSGCDPRVVNSPTKYPIRSQIRGQTGVVFIDVQVDENGVPSAATLRQSSGHRRLDRAATASVLKGWRFDVSSCERKDLPATDVVAVEYRNGVYGH